MNSRADHSFSMSELGSVSSGMARSCESINHRRRRLKKALYKSGIDPVLIENRHCTLDKYEDSLVNKRSMIDERREKCYREYNLKNKRLKKEFGALRGANEAFRRYKKEKSEQIDRNLSILENLKKECLKSAKLYRVTKKMVYDIEKQTRETEIRTNDIDLSQIVYETTIYKKKIEETGNLVRSEELKVDDLDSKLLFIKNELKKEQKMYNDMKRRALVNVKEREEKNSQLNRELACLRGETSANQRKLDLKNAEKREIEASMAIRTRNLQSFATETESIDLQLKGAKYLRLQKEAELCHTNDNQAGVLKETVVVSDRSRLLKEKLGILEAKISHLEKEIQLLLSQREEISHTKVMEIAKNEELDEEVAKFEHLSTVFVSYLDKINSRLDEQKEIENYKPILVPIKTIDDFFDPNHMKNLESEATTLESESNHVKEDIISLQQSVNQLDLKISTLQSAVEKAITLSQEEMQFLGLTGTSATYDSIISAIKNKIHAPEHSPEALSHSIQQLLTQIEQAEHRILIKRATLENKASKLQKLQQKLENKATLPLEIQKRETKLRALTISFKDEARDWLLVKNSITSRRLLKNWELTIEKLIKLHNS